MKFIQKIVIILLILATLMVVGCTETDEGGVEDTVTSTEPPQEEIVEPVVVQEEEKAVTSISTPPEVTSSDTYTSDENAKLLIEMVVNNYGIYGVNTRIADGRVNGGVKVLIFSYRSNALTENEIAIEMGCILGAYLGIVEDGWDVDELSVVVGDTYGNAVGIWYCTEDWTNDYINGKMSNEDLLIKVLSSMTAF